MVLEHASVRRASAELKLDDLRSRRAAAYTSQQSPRLLDDWDAAPEAAAPSKPRILRNWATVYEAEGPHDESGDGYCRRPTSAAPLIGAGSRLRSRGRAALVTRSLQLDDLRSRQPAEAQGSSSSSSSSRSSFRVSISNASWQPGPWGSSPAISPDALAGCVADGRARAAEFASLLAGPAGSPPSTDHFQRPRSLHASSLAFSSELKRFELAKEPMIGFRRRDDFGQYQSGVEIAKAWDQRHARHVRAAERLHRVLQQSASASSLSTPHAFHDALWEIRRERPQLVRLWTTERGPQTVAGKKAEKKGVKHSVVGIEWDLEHSIFGPRKAWADSADYLDTQEHVIRCVLCDWERALDDHNTRGE